LLSLSRNQLRILPGLLTGHLFNLGLVNSPEYDRLQAGIWDGLTLSLKLWCFSHIEIQAPALSLYATRWLWRHLCWQYVAVCSRSGAAEWMSSRSAQGSITAKVYGSMPTLLYSILFCTKTNIPVPYMWTDIRVLNC